MLVHAYFTGPEYAQLSPRAVKCLLDLYTQYRGANNGDLSAAWSIMSKLGWRSRSQLAGALKELTDLGWILQTRQGWNRTPSLYAVTWLGIDRCDGKIDVKPNATPLHSWRRAAAVSAPRPRDAAPRPQDITGVADGTFTPPAGHNRW